MDYTNFRDEIVGYELSRTFVGGTKRLLLKPINFGEVIEPYLAGADTDVSLYLRLKEHLGHIRDDKQCHLDDGEWLNPELLTGLDLEKRAIKNVMFILQKNSEDPKKTEWDNMSWMDYLSRQTDSLHGQSGQTKQ